MRLKILHHQYKYLGILFSSSGTFSHCQNDLYKRALRANFKSQKCLGDIKPNINTLLHLFDHTVKPILTYGCEIWGTLNQTSSIFKTNKDYKIEKSVENMQCEKLHIKFLKFSLGVHKKSTNDAVMGELGTISVIYK